jgi:NAD-dependent SIR2 family protein deacetylase
MLLRHLDPGPLPRCARCDRPLKPGYVLFEEPVRNMVAIDRLLRDTDLLLVIGTSAQVTPASLFPDGIRARGGKVIEFNLEATTLTPTLRRDGAFVQGPAGLTLPGIAERVLSHRRPEAP